MPRKGQFKPGPPVGSQFGKLVVIESDLIIEESDQRVLASRCRCECGSVLVMRNYVLKRTGTRSCGCTRKHGAARRGEQRSRTYSLWQNMITRCKRDPRYSHVSVCDTWLASYENFLADMGKCPDGLSLDRIDNSGNYEPTNCRWTDAKTQNNNRRSNRRITFNGETRTVKGWMELNGLDYSTFYRRLSLGWDEVSAAALPKGSRKPA
jgi:hypothetical protein